MRAHIGWVVICLLIGVTVAFTLRACKDDPRQRNWRVYVDHNMAYSPAYTAQEPNPVFADGRTGQPPPDGAIPMGAQPYPFGPLRDGYTDAESEMRLAGALWPAPRTPLADGAEVAQRGGELYLRFCSTCHGVTGMGDGPIASYIAAAQIDLGLRATQLTDGELFYIITRGGRAGVMGSYASQTSESDRWHLIRYLRTLPGASASTTTPTDSGSQTQPDNGASGTE